MSSDKNSADSEQDSGSLLKSSAAFGLMTMLSRFFGLLRDITIARLFGADASADAFFLAFKIPNFLRRLFAEGAFSQAFVPVLSEYRETRSLAEVRDLINRVSGVLGGVVLLVTVFAVFGAPLVATIFAPGFIGNDEQFALVTDMIRVTFPYLFFITMAGFVGAILNSYGHFALPAFTPVLLNLMMITGALASVHFDRPIFGLAWGVFMAGVLQLLFQLPTLKRLELFPRPRWDTAHPGVRQILTLMLPAIFGVSVAQINLLLDSVIASFLPKGSISWLYYSDRLWELPLGVFGVALATVILPSLSRQDAGGKPEAFNRTLDWALRLVVFVAIPAAAALVVLAEPILYTLFQYGKMTPGDVTMSALSLRAYTAGLLAFMLVKVLAPGFYSRQDMKTPVRIGIIAMVANMVLNLLFVLPLHHYWQVGHVGLAMATTTSSFLNAWLLYRGLRRQDVFQPRQGWGMYWFRIILATATMVAALLYLLPATEFWAGADAWQRLLALIPLVLAGAGTYFLILFVGGLRPRALLDKPL